MAKQNRSEETTLVAWNSSDCFESFSPLNSLNDDVTEKVITTRSNRMKFRLQLWFSIIIGCVANRIRVKECFFCIWCSELRVTYAYSFPSFIAYQSSAGLHWVPGAFHALFPVSVSLKVGVFYRLGSHNTPINVMPAGRRQGMGWGFDCLCWPWCRAFDWSRSPREGDIWILLRPTWRYLTADSDEKDWDRTYVSRFHASSMRCTVCKDLEIMEANGNKRKLSGFHCFVFKFRLF